MSRRRRTKEEGRTRGRGLRMRRTKDEDLGGGGLEGGGLRNIYDSMKPRAFGIHECSNIIYYSVLT